MACLADYKMLKIIEETKSAKNFTAERGGITYLVNAFYGRDTIGEYMPVLAGLSSERLPEFSEWFSENSVLYAVFRYENGVPLIKYLEKEKLPLKYRLLILKNIAYKLAELESGPLLLQKTVVKPENIVVSEDGLLFNYKISPLPESPVQDSVYGGVSELMDELFSQAELHKSSGLKIVSDKCEKGVYGSFAELAKDIDGLLAEEEKELDLKAAVTEKYKTRARIARNILTVACILLAGVFLYYEYAVKSREGVPTFAPVTEIGSVNVDSPAEDEPAVEEGEIRRIVYVYESAAPPEPTEPQSEEPEPVTDAEPEAIPDEDTEENIEAPEYETYIVTLGDNLTKICSEYYGSADMVYTVAEYNRLENPSLLFVGQELKLPLLYND